MADTNSKLFLPAELSLITAIRDEADHTKEMFAKYSFQSWAFTVGFLAILMRMQPDQYIIGIAGALPILLLMAVLRIGIYSYTTANRIYGFELYLNRRRRITVAREKELELGWEEANYVWRTVQASLYSEVLRKAHQAERPENGLSLLAPLRILIGSLIPISEPEDTILFRHRPIEDGFISVYSGSFLKSHFFIVFILCALCHIPILLSSIHYFSEAATSEVDKFKNSAYFVISAIFLIGTPFITYRRGLRLVSRRRILEDGMLSINCCALLWRISAFIHFNVIEELERTQGGRGLTSYQGYTEGIHEETKKLITSYRDKKDEGIYSFLGEYECFAPRGTF